MAKQQPQTSSKDATFPDAAPIPTADGDTADPTVVPPEPEPTLTNPPSYYFDPELLPGSDIAPNELREGDVFLHYQVAKIQGGTTQGPEMVNGYRLLERVAPSTSFTTGVAYQRVPQDGDGQGITATWLGNQWVHITAEGAQEFLPFNPDETWLPLGPTDQK